MFIFSPLDSFGAPSAFGTYQLEGRTVNVQNDDESPLCAGYSASLHIELIDSDKLVLTLIESDCPDRPEIGTYNRISFDT